MKGKVYLVGAGPGDIGLLTLRAKELIELADVIVYDRLLNERVLDFAKPGCEKIYAGKEAGFHCLPQRDIEKLLCKYAVGGKTVVRLKGGDPYMFGRGAEEALYLAEKKIKFEVVPGVTSAIAGPAYAGIPLTQRDCAGTVTFITGHKKDNGGLDGIDWKNLGANKGTLVFLMGLSNIAAICEHLIKNGKNKKTRAAVISRATFHNQKQVFGTLFNIARKTREAKIISPAIIIIGGVVSFHNKLNWVAKKHLPMAGKTILVVRSKEKQQKICGRLEGLGAETIAMPAIKHIPVNTNSAKHLLQNAHNYDYLIITSPSTIDFIIAAMEKLNLDIRALRGPKLCAMGPGTLQSLKEKNLKVDILPKRFIAEGLLEIFKNKNIRGKNFLIIRSANARNTLPDGLKKQGARVDILNIYAVVPDIPSREALNKIVETVKSGRLDLAVIMSSSQAKNLAYILKKRIPLKKIRCACIGPEAEAEARAQGFTIAVKSREYSLSGLVSSIARHYKKTG